MARQKKQHAERDEVNGQRNIDFFSGRFRLRIKPPGHDEIRESFDTLKAAVARRNELRLQFPDTLLHRFRSKPMNSKASYGRVGISRTEKVDHRKAGKPRYVVFAVNWIDDSGRKRVTAFQAGNAAVVTKADLRRAERTAVAFREAYEYARLHGMRFQPGYYVNWRSMQCYPFVPPEPQATAASTRVVKAAKVRAGGSRVIPRAAPPPKPPDEAISMPAEAAAAAPGRAIDESEVARLCEQRPDLGQFRAVMLIARLRTCERALAFLDGSPAEQERIWAPAEPSRG